MKLFISWSGSVSLEIATVLQEWIRDVIHDVEPFLSSEEIHKGKRWSAEIAAALEEIQYGIICLTPDNTKSPWINFEAGALSKSVEDSLVAPILFGIDSVNEIPTPLQQFQVTKYQDDDMRRMMHSINARTDRPLDEARFNRAFDIHWPRLQEHIAPFLLKISKDGTEQSPTALGDPTLGEILDLVRSQQRTFDRVTGDPFFTFRGNVRLDPLHLSDYRQLAIGLAMLKNIAHCQWHGYHVPEDAIERTLEMLREPLETILARGHAPHIHSLYFDDEHETLRLRYSEDALTFDQTIGEVHAQIDTLNADSVSSEPPPVAARDASVTVGSQKQRRPRKDGFSSAQSRAPGL